MADKNFFIIQIDRLRSNFGQNHYKNEVAQFIWDEVKSIPNPTLKKIVDDFIAELRFAPKRKEFREAIKNHSPKLNHEQRQIPKREFILNPSSAEEVTKSIGDILKKMDPLAENEVKKTPINKFKFTLVG